MSPKCARNPKLNKGLSQLATLQFATRTQPHGLHRSSDKPYCSVRVRGGVELDWCEGEFVCPVGAEVRRTVAPANQRRALVADGAGVGGLE